MFSHELILPLGPVLENHMTESHMLLIAFEKHTPPLTVPWFSSSVCKDVGRHVL